MNMFNVNSSYLHLDKTLFIIVIILTLFGLYLQFNIGTSLGDRLQMRLFMNQFKYICLSIIVFCMFYFPKQITQYLHDFSLIFVLLLIGLLSFVLARGVMQGGATRWVRFGFVTFQPSSLAHPVLIILFAKYFTKNELIIYKTGFFAFLKEFKMLAIVTGTIFALILFEKHLSTLIVLGATLMAMIFVMNFKKSLLVMLSLILVLGVGIVLLTGHTYRSTRLRTYVNYSLFPRLFGVEQKQISKDEGYQIQESLTAISQGGFWGVGQNQGRAKHKYVPDINSDFIFTIIAEERGFLGGAVIIVLFTIFLYRVMKISSSSKWMFEHLLAFGFGINIFITAIINIGVSLSALPVTGLPLPFISHGGSALIVNVAMIAIILNISRERRLESEM